MGGDGEVEVLLGISSYMVHTHHKRYLEMHLESEKGVERETYHSLATVATNALQGTHTHTRTHTLVLTITCKTLRSASAVLGIVHADSPKEPAGDPMVAVH
jgi:hypothetical protein